ncbi:uncharacterized protein BDZ83DRAFT_227125 [Colletotrichum acutatum]|uniref:Uncharacterized protein n=1 Tax=Glomerella acutata TaxID=27357 RepID=A0AAD8XGG7_GLOAC|nr:uncharacterized protein BDZ83DRAFT_227125 [Colletotrichum acutatum]KAK1727064.1 hypothetical protein BDZ83DRAFT_227125 [Colletotrichum acutatum]
MQKAMCGVCCSSLHSPRSDSLAWILERFCSCVFFIAWGDCDLRVHLFIQNIVYIFFTPNIRSLLEMAEVLGIVASVAALIQLAKYGEKFAKVLIRYSKQSSSPGKEVERCAFQAQDFSDCIDMTQFALERHFDKYTESSLLQYLLSQGILQGILNRSKLIKWQLEMATKNI